MSLETPAEKSELLPGCCLLGCQEGPRLSHGSGTRVGGVACLSLTVTLTLSLFHFEPSESCSSGWLCLSDARPFSRPPTRLLPPLCGSAGSSPPASQGATRRAGCSGPPATAPLSCGAPGLAFSAHGLHITGSLSSFPQQQAGPAFPVTLSLGWRPVA